MSFPISKLKNGSHAIVTVCSHCSTLRAFFDFNKMTNKFPDTGYWIDCMACGTFRMFYRVVRGCIVVKESGSQTFCRSRRRTRQCVKEREALDV